MDMLEMVSILLTQITDITHDRIGNLHLNVIADSYAPEIQAALEPFVYELVGM